MTWYDKLIRLNPETVSDNRLNGLLLKPEVESLAPELACDMLVRAVAMRPCVFSAMTTPEHQSIF